MLIVTDLMYSSRLHGSSDISRPKVVLKVDVRSTKRMTVRMWAIGMTGSEPLQNCSSCGCYCTGQHLSAGGLGKDRWWQGHLGSGGWPRRSNRWAAGAPTPKEVHVGSEGKVSGHTEHHRLAADHSGLPRWPLSTTDSTNNGMSLLQVFSHIWHQSSFNCSATAGSSPGLETCSFSVSGQENCQHF